MTTYEFTCPNCSQHYECGIRPGLSFMCQKCSFTFMPQVEYEALSSGAQAAVEALKSTWREGDQSELRSNADKLDDASGTSHWLGILCLIIGGLAALMVGSQAGFLTGAVVFASCLLLRCVFAVLERLAGINAALLRIQSELSKK
jgi:Flp pilus assembly protein TadB